MKLYEIEQALENLIDPESGEILDYEEFENLIMARTDKLENIALWIKNLRAEAAALKAEKDSFAAREKAAKTKAERLTHYLTMMLNGEKFKTDRVAISYRKSTATVVDSEFMDWAMFEGDEYLKYAQPEPNLTAIKEAIDAGQFVPHAQLVERYNIQIK